MSTKSQIPYQYHNLPIPGGGYVTGFVFHKRVPGILYIRTDIGGTYKYDYVKKRWISLIDHVTMFDLSESFPIALALDDSHPERLYIACGVNPEDLSRPENKDRQGVLAVSDNFGKHFKYKSIPCLVHGNLNGRGTGNRLIVDPNNSDVIYFASQKDGLLKSEDRGETWRKCDVCGEDWMTFVWVSPDSSTIIVSTAGVTNKIDDSLRGQSMYVSYDAGSTFHKMQQPVSVRTGKSRMSGYVGQRYDYDGTFFYVTFAQTGQYSYVVENGYSCDSGDNCGGRVLRYFFDANGMIGGYHDITPTQMSGYHKEDFLNFGFGGISCCETTPGLLATSTICRKPHGDILYISKDHGTNWEVALYDLEVGNLHIKTPYMKPEYNGNHSIIHWMSDVKINPFNENEIWFNSGTGVFGSRNFLDNRRIFSDICEGIEETVHLNIYSPAKGDVKLIDILGDLGGFAFRDLKNPCENSFDDENRNRYITCINCDFSDHDPNFAIITPRGNWTGLTKGGLIITRDEFKTFQRLPMPFGISDLIDDKLSEIENPNVNSGWVSVSSDQKNIVWSIADGIQLPKSLVVTSTNNGKEFQKTKIFDINKKECNKGFMKTFSDRMNPNIFYGFGDHSDFYISTDGGLSFYERMKVENFPEIDFSMIDCANKTEVRGNCGEEGVFYMALGSAGIYKMVYDIANDSLEFKRLTKEGDVYYRLGLGIGRDCSSYFESKKTLFTSAIISGTYGFYRSFDEGNSWERINTDQQMFGEINSVEGDSKCFGRFYLATGSRGVIVGEPI